MKLYGKKSMGFIFLFMGILFIINSILHYYNDENNTLHILSFFEFTLGLAAILLFFYSNKYPVIKIENNKIFVNKFLWVYTPIDLDKITSVKKSFGYYIVKTADQSYEVPYESLKNTDQKKIHDFMNGLQ